MDNNLSSNTERDNNNLKLNVQTAKKRKMKDLYACLLNQPVFTIEDVNEFYGNIDSARSAVKRLMREGLVAKIRNNRYTCINLQSGKTIANRFQIASSLTATSYVSHHTALEYHGIADPVNDDVYVSSATFFHDFEFDGYRYKFVTSKCQDGIIRPEADMSVTVTDLERTLTDSIKSMDKISGINEVCASLARIGKIDEEKLLRYLNSYDNQFLYQKTGYLMTPYQEQTGLTDRFFDICREQIGKSRRYLTNDMIGGRYDSDWKMMVP